ncbi:MAG: alanine racemase [Desulfovibrionales bacterium]
MSISYNKVMTRIHLATLCANYQFLQKQAAQPIAVIKADAYGHGLKEVAAALVETGAREFAVGTAGEGALLREEFQGPIVALLGTMDKEDCRQVWEHDLIPLIHRPGQCREIAEAGPREGTLRVALKFDTGMSRLGFSPEESAQVVQELEKCPNLKVDMVCSHLACADEPESEEFVRVQASRFRDLCRMIGSQGHRFRECLVNSAGILAYPDLHLDAQRPGIALYGSNPFAGTAWEAKGKGLIPAMETVTTVVAVHELQKGRSISYGRTFTADRDMRVAIVAAGYADNYSRGLSNVGQVLVRGRRASILGRVCMQLTAVDVTAHPGVAPADPVHLLGGEGPEAISPEELASWWGTITYEVFCLLGQNRRVYLRGDESEGQQ